MSSSASTSISTAPAPVKRACDGCKHRKVKCDAGSPCANCRISHIHCAYTIPSKKRGPKFRSATRRHRTLEPPSISVAAQDFQISPLPNTSSHTLVDTLTGSHASPVSHSPRSVPSAHSWNPCMVPSADTLVSGPGLIDDIFNIYDCLLSSIDTAIPDSSINAVVSECIDLYMQFLFPIMPIVHEPTLRGNITLLSAEVLSIRGTLSNRWAGTNPHRTAGVELPALQSFTLLTALCAEAACILPPQLFAKGPAIADYFLEASRNLLKLYHDKDIEQPHSSSLVIRYFHSNCTHAAGKIRLSWYLLGEAIRMAQEMRLHDESSLEGLDSVEAQLRRNVFWQLYTGDKSAALLNNRPFTLHEFNLNTKISISYTSQQNTSLLDVTREHNAEPFESCIMTGFNLCQRLWSLASDLLLNLRMFQPFSLRLLAAPSLTEEQRAALMDAYVQYMSLLDDMPAWLRHPESDAQYPNNSDRKYQTFCFWIQRINLQVSFQCLRLIILQKFVDLGLSSLLGISSEPLMVALRKTEIAQDMLNMILEAPFESLQVNGEPCVEKIRQVGASLLEITQNIDNPRIAARAHSDFSVLLDILARLNSKAADAL